MRQNATIRPGTNAIEQATTTRCGKREPCRGSIDVSMGLNLAFVDVVGMASNNRRIVFTRGAAG